MTRGTKGAPEHEALDKRALWGEGPWESEPDRVEFVHRGVPCLMVRQPEFGNWCGYAGVEPGHPWHGVDRDDELLDDVQVHGGLTWAGPAKYHIQSLADPARYKGHWWLGYDCAHGGDLVPMFNAMGTPWLRSESTRYRDVAFVRGQCEQLADQVAKALGFTP